MILVYACFRSSIHTFAEDSAANERDMEFSESLRRDYLDDDHRPLQSMAMRDFFPVEQVKMAQMMDNRLCEIIPITDRRQLRSRTLDVVDKSTQTAEQLQCVPNSLVNAADRIFGILEVPVVLVFGIILYLVDVGSDIAAAVSYFQKGHHVWGSLTVTFVAFPCICSAAFSWTYWYYSNKSGTEKERVKPKRRRVMMVLSVLLLEPLAR